MTPLIGPNGLLLSSKVHVDGHVDGLVDGHVHVDVPIRTFPGKSNFRLSLHSKFDRKVKARVTGPRRIAKVEKEETAKRKSKYDFA